MLGERQKRRFSDPGLQPERTSLAWFRMVLAFCALAAFSLKSHHGTVGRALDLFLLLSCALIGGLYMTARKRSTIDVRLIGLQVDDSDQLLRLITLTVLAMIVLSALPRLIHVLAMICQSN